MEELHEKYEVEEGESKSDARPKTTFLWEVFHGNKEAYDQALQDEEFYEYKDDVTGKWMCAKKTSSTRTLHGTRWEGGRGWCCHAYIYIHLSDYYCDCIF